MRLKSFNYLVGLLIIFSHQLISYEKIDIWKNNKETSLEQQNKKIRRK